jgi:hypothetical protein
MGCFAKDCAPPSTWPLRKVIENIKLSTLKLRFMHLKSIEHLVTSKKE